MSPASPHWYFSTLLQMKIVLILRRETWNDNLHSCLILSTSIYDYFQPPTTFCLFNVTGAWATWRLQHTLGRWRPWRKWPSATGSTSTTTTPRSPWRATARRRRTARQLMPKQSAQTFVRQFYILPWWDQSVGHYLRLFFRRKCGNFRICMYYKALWKILSKSH